MRNTTLHALHCQVTRRVTPLNQAWSWASAIQAMTASLPCALKFPGDHRSPPSAQPRHLEWLVMEMAWTCEDLEDAGAWRSEVELELPSFDDPAQALDLVEAMLTRLEATAGSGVPEIAVLAETQARARACRLALELQPRDRGHAAEAA